MMFKKITALFLAAVLCFSMAACTGNDDGETTNESKQGSETNIADEPYVPLPPFENEGDNDGANDGNAGGGSQSAKNPDKEPTENTVRVTLTEGMTLVKMSWALRDAGVCSSEAFIEASQNVDFSKYPLVAAAMKVPHVCFKLEGYLQPDTYEFYKNESPEIVLDKLLRAREAAITSEIRSRAAQLGYSVHEILTLASIIEKEAQSNDQRANISSALHNRLDIVKMLECDVTINYVEGVIYEIYGKNNDYRYYYNTYKCAALPAGPICNPGMASIKAALYPADTDYLFFAVKNGKALYAKDYNTHLKNCDELGIEM